jgi:pre-mRNA-splicing factor CWC26
MLSEMMNKDKGKSAESQYEWGGGLKSEQKKEEISSKSFTIAVDDEDRERKLKEQHRWGDPMAGFVSSSAAKGGSKKSKKSKKTLNLEYTGVIRTPNRFGIKPGVNWDGVDRSNHWEEKLFLQRNKLGVSKQNRFNYEQNDL